MFKGLSSQMFDQKRGNSFALNKVIRIYINSRKSIRIKVMAS